MELFNGDFEQGLSRAATRLTKDQLIANFLDENQLKIKLLQTRQMRKVKPSKGGQSIVVLFSDWHLGKVVIDENKKVVYNTEIAKERIETTLVDQLMQKINCIDKTKKVDEIVFVMAGDMVDNDVIYDTQRFHIDSGVAIQFNNVVNSIIFLIKNVQAECKKVFKKIIPIQIHGISGNHGRPSQKSEIGSCSWDTAVYAAVQMVVSESVELKKNVRVDFSIADQMVVDVRGFKGLVTHGGPPQAETASAKRKFGGLYEIFNYDFAMYGHRHHWGIATYNGRPLFMNGSLCGSDDYALKLAVRDDWSQLMFTITDNVIGRQMMRLEEE